MNRITCNHCGGPLTVNIDGGVIVITSRATIGEPAPADGPPSALASDWCSECVEEMTERIS